MNRRKCGCAGTFLLLALWVLPGCGVFRAMGIASTTDIGKRRGPGGTPEAPFELNPLRSKILVLAAHECRDFQVRLPKDWYWKVTLTASTRGDNSSASLSAELRDEGGGYAPVPPFEKTKSFRLSADSRQGVIALANQGPDRPLVLRLCQDGAPVKVVMESQVSAFGNALMAPPVKSVATPPDAP